MHPLISVFLKWAFEYLLHFMVSHLSNYLFHLFILYIQKTKQYIIQSIQMYSLSLNSRKLNFLHPKKLKLECELNFDNHSLIN